MKLIHTKLRNTNLHNVTRSLISRKPREHMCVVQISLLIVTFLSLISRNLSLIQTTKGVNPHPHIVPWVHMWSATFLFFFLCHCWMLVHAYTTLPGAAKWSGPHHTVKMLHFVLFQSVTCYTSSIVSCIHVNTTKLRNIMCTLVAIGVTLRSLECTHVTLLTLNGVYWFEILMLIPKLNNLKTIIKMQ